MTSNNPSYHRQIEDFVALAAKVGAKCFAVSTHKSKSITLPVVSIRLPGVTMVMRNNFHDVSVSIDCEDVPTIDLGALFGAHDWAWYLEQIRRCRGYSFKGWTDEEMADPRILRVYVQPRHSANPGYWSAVSGEAKDRWAARMTDPAWYGEDWSSGALVFDGPMGPGSTCHDLPRAFAEGMQGVVPDAHLRQWRPGQRGGILCLRGMDKALALAQMLSTPSTDGETP